MMKLLFVALSMLLVVNEGHMCLLNPYQRNGTVPDSELRTPGSSYCLRLTGPCGGINADREPVGTVYRGEKSTAVLEKNLDHFNATSGAGKFTLALWDDKGNKVSDLGSTADDNGGSGSIYQIEYEIPASTKDGIYIMQAVYATNNPSAPPEFYQCSDVRVQ